MPLPDEVRELFEGPNYAHVATVLPDGSPHTVPVWAGVEDGRIVFFTQRDSRKARNLVLDPRVAISVVDFERPYRSAHVRGRVVATRAGEAALAVMDRIAERYTGEPFPVRGPNGILFEVEAQHARYTELPFEHRPSS